MYSWGRYPAALVWFQFFQTLVVDLPLLVRTDASAGLGIDIPKGTWDEPSIYIVQYMWIQSLIV